MCDYQAGYAGKCKNADDPFCDEHKKIKCDVCGKQAVRECCNGMSVICGYPLCATCECKRHFDPRSEEEKVAELLDDVGNIVDEFLKSEKLSRKLEALKTKIGCAGTLHGKKILTLSVYLKAGERNFISRDKWCVE